jgi:hypothetical protein
MRDLKIINQINKCGKNGRIILSHGIPHRKYIYSETSLLQ